MTNRTWTKIEEIDDKSYLVQYSEVDTHEGASIGGFVLLLLESEQELAEQKSER